MVERVFVQLHIGIRRELVQCGSFAPLELAGRFDVRVEADHGAPGRQLLHPKPRELDGREVIRGVREDLNLPEPRPAHTLHHLEAKGARLDVGDGKDIAERRVRRDAAGHLDTVGEHPHLGRQAGCIRVLEAADADVVHCRRLLKRDLDGGRVAFGVALPGGRHAPVDGHRGVPKRRIAGGGRDAAGGGGGAHRAGSDVEVAVTLVGSGVVRGAAGREAEAQAEGEKGEAGPVGTQGHATRVADAALEAPGT